MHSYNSWILWVLPVLSGISHCVVYFHSHTWICWTEKKVKVYASISYISSCHISFYMSSCQWSLLQDLFSIFLIVLSSKNQMIFTLREWAWKSQYIAIVPSSSSFFISCFTWYIEIIGRYMLSVFVFFSNWFTVNITKGQSGEYFSWTQQTKWTLLERLGERPLLSHSCIGGLSHVQQGYTCNF